MTDRPTIEQQLARVISKADRYAGAKPLAAAIIAAVSNGTLDPIIPAWADEVTIAELTEPVMCRPECGEAAHIEVERGRTMTDELELEYEWWLDDEGHPWVRHQCADEEIAWRLPPPWKVEGDRITPSLDCQKCGLHIFIGPDEHVERLWNWEIKLDILCGSCDGKATPDPDCEWCNGTGIDQERAGYPSVTDEP